MSPELIGVSPIYGGNANLISDFAEIPDARCIVGLYRLSGDVNTRDWTIWTENRVCLGSWLLRSMINNNFVFGF